MTCSDTSIIIIVAIVIITIIIITIIIIIPNKKLSNAWQILLGT